MLAFITENLNGSQTEAEVKLDQDTVFHLLSNSRRRAVLKILAEHENLDERELVNRVAAREYGLSVEELSSDERHRVYVSLQQCHLPKMEDHGVIETDHNRVRIGETANQLLEYI